VGQTCLRERGRHRRKGMMRVVSVQSGNSLGTRLHIAVFARRTDYMMSILSTIIQNMTLSIDEIITSRH